MLPQVFAEFNRILCGGGILQISVPDSRLYCEWVTKGDRRADPRLMTGGQTDEHHFHKAMLDEGMIRRYLARYGFVGERRFKPWVEGDTSHNPISLNMEAIKPGRVFATFEPNQKVCLGMTRPRLGYTKCAESIMRLMHHYPMRAVTCGGAFWEQGITKVAERAIADGFEYLLTVDYDTVFDVTDFERLIVYMESAPWIDALAAVQAKRDPESKVLFSTVGPLRRGDTMGSVVEVDTAHFGFTIFRLEAFERMTKPWCLGVPDPDGSWHKGRIDPDIFFWKNWAASGNTTCMSNMIPVGHIMEVVAWPGWDLQVHYQHGGDYEDFGKPEIAKRFEWCTPLDTRKAGE